MGGHKRIGIDPPEEPLKTAFGELSVESKTPKINHMFQYNINAEIWNTSVNNTATVTQSDGKAVVQTGATANTFSLLKSKETLKYIPGVGGDILFTALFTAGVAGSEQTVGVGDQEDGFFFGYNEASFGVLKRQGGERDIHEITITAGAGTGTGNITIKLDGDDTTVAVTNGDSVEQVVGKIVATDFSGAGGGWETYKVDNATVKFISMLAESAAGSFTFTDTGTTGVTASAITEILAGAVPTDAWTPQTAWNRDKMDGAGPSGQTLDHTKGNVYKIQYQWLGFGSIVFSVEISGTGMFQIVHVIEYANLNTSPSINNPTLPISFISKNIANDTNIKVQGSSIAAFIEGRNDANGIPHSHSNAKTGIGVVETNLVTIRNKLIYQGAINRISVIPTFLSVSVDNVNDARVTLIRQGNVAGAVAWVDHGTNESVAEIDVAGGVVTGGTEVFSTLVPKNSADQIALKQFNIELHPGESLVVSATSGGGNGAFSAILNWSDLL